MKPNKTERFRDLAEDRPLIFEGRMALFSFTLIAAILSTYGCSNRDDTSAIADGDASIRIESDVSVGVFFADKSSGMWRESVLINGKEEVSISDGMETVMEKIRSLSAKRVAVFVGKAPPDNLESRILELQQFCDKELIELDLSADELFFLRGGTVDFRGTSN